MAAYFAKTGAGTEDGRLLDNLSTNDGPAVALMQAGLSFGLNLGTAIVLLVVGYVLARRAQAFVRNRLNAIPNFDPTLVPFVGTLVRYVVLGFTFILVLSEFGIQTTSIIAVLGAAGLAIGLALQGTLQNVAAGIMLLVLRPFQIGHYVEAGGTSGTVDEIGLFVTILRTPQNVLRVVPNSKIFGDVIANYNAFERMRLDLTVGISYDDDIAKAVDVLRAMIEAQPNILRDPEPLIITKALADSAVDLEIRAWVLQADYWSMRFTLTEAVKHALDAGGINIPYPHRQIVISDGGQSPPPKTASRKTTRTSKTTRRAA